MRGNGAIERILGEGRELYIAYSTKCERIKAQCTLTQDTSYQQMKMQQAKSLQQTSKGRVKNWPNTLEAMRVNREEERIKRLEDEEVSPLLALPKF